MAIHVPTLSKQPIHLCGSSSFSEYTTNLVERGGIEPPSSPCKGDSFPLAYRPKSPQILGGPPRTRTGNSTFVASRVIQLYQRTVLNFDKTGVLGGARTLKDSVHSRACLPFHHKHHKNSSHNLVVPFGLEPKFQSSEDCALSN